MNKQSLFHIAKRDALPWYKSMLIRGGAILLALIVCALVTTLLTGENPISVYSTIFYGAFGTARKTWVTFQNLAVLLGISLAVTPAFKMRFWNIGAEGQVLIGCLATAACMICLGAEIARRAGNLHRAVAERVRGGSAYGQLNAMLEKPPHQRQHAGLQLRLLVIVPADVRGNDFIDLGLTLHRLIASLEIRSHFAHAKREYVRLNVRLRYTVQILEHQIRNCIPHGAGIQNCAVHIEQHGLWQLMIVLFHNLSISCGCRLPVM